jgi:DNA-binding LacI/PurR family transcriptional regulator
MPIEVSLGATLKDFFISRATLANDMDISLQSVHNWCTGRIHIPIPQLGRLADRLSARGIPDDAIAGLIANELEAQGLDPKFLPLLADPTALQSPAMNQIVMIIAWDMERAAPFGYVAHLCRTSLEQMGIECLLADCGGEHRLKRSYLKQAVAMRCAGVMMVGIPGEVPDRNDDLLSTIEPAVAAGVPVVLAMPWMGSLNLPRGTAGIGWDATATGVKAAEFLVENRHTEIAYLSADGGLSNEARFEGFSRSLAERGVAAREDLAVWPTDDSSTFVDVERVLRPATAVFAAPLSLPKLARACYSAGRTWPQDISIISMGHEAFIREYGPRPITYIALPMGKVARGAAHLLKTMLAGDENYYGQEFAVYGPSSMPVVNANLGSMAPLAKGQSRSKS